MWPSLATVSFPLRCANPRGRSGRSRHPRSRKYAALIGAASWSSKPFTDEQCSGLARQAGANPDDIRLAFSGRKSMKRRLYRGADYRRAQNIEELRETARRRTPNFSFEYVEGGAEDEVTLRRNRAVFEEIAFLPRTLVDVAERRQDIALFGKTSASPFLIGPTGFNGLLTHRGDVALARAASKAGIPFVLSNASTVALEEVAAEAGGRVWMQLYLYRTREYAAQLVERVARAGLEVLVVTTDSAIFGNREWDKRNYRRPLQLDLRNTIDVALHPRWLFDVMVPHGMPRFKNLGDLLPPGEDSARGAAFALARELDPSLNWDDIQWLRQQWSGKLIVKGILTVEDALLAAECGVDGIVLINHGGRQLDGAISAMGAGADLEGPHAGGLDPLCAEGAGQPDDAETGAEALLGMRPFGQDHVAQQKGRGADPAGLGANTVDRPVGVAPMRGRHVLGNGGVLAVPADPAMDGDALAAQEDLDGSRRQTDLDLLARVAVRGAVVVAVDLDMVVEPDPASPPLGQHVGLHRQRLQRWPVELFEQLPAGDAQAADGTLLVETHQQFADRGVELAQAVEGSMTQPAKQPALDDQPGGPPLRFARRLGGARRQRGGVVGRPLLGVGAVALGVEKAAFDPRDLGVVGDEKRGA